MRDRDNHTVEKKMYLQRQLGIHLHGHHFLGIDRSIAGTHKIYGYLLGHSRSLVFINENIDFRPDGFRVVRLDDVKKVWRDRVMERLLKSEGVSVDLGVSEKIDISSWKALFHGLKRLGRNIIVEGEDRELDEFKIGRILRVNKQSLQFRHFDGKARWEKVRTAIPYKDITTVAWECNYINVFSRYVK